ncbi:MAG TPA: hypothetical protein DGG95_17665, partial [Cytophagales bacterium]|nr:hypothetical protein [Cytophagales bacterium]
ILGTKLDITARKKAEENLRQSEERFKLLYNHTPAMMHAIDENERIVRVSDYWLQKMGYTREEVLGKKSTDFLTEESRVKAREIDIPELFKTGKVNNVEHQFRTKDGQILDTLLSASREYENGKVFKAMAVITDISEKKKLEKEVNKLAMIASRTNNAVIITDADQKITWVNDGFERITEYSSHEVMGRNPKFLQGPETKPETIQRMHHALSKGEDIKVELLNYSKTGKKYWLDIEVIPLYEHNILNGFIAIELDITTLKESLEEIKKTDESLRSLASNIPNGVLYQAYYKDGGRGFNFISIGIEKITGEPISKFLADPKFIFSVIHPEDVHLLLKSQSDYESLEVFDEEIRMIHKNGDVRWMHMRSKLRKIGEANFIRDGFLIDITERKKAEIELRKTSRLLAVTSQINKMVVHATNSAQVFSEACRIVVKYGEFRMAWIGRIDQQTENVIPLVHYGYENGYLSVIPKISILDKAEGRGATGRAVRERRLIINNDLANNPNSELWKAEAQRRNYQASIAFPIIVQDKVKAVFTLYHSEPFFFSDQEVKLLGEIETNIAFALETIENETIRKQAKLELEAAKNRLELATQAAGLGIWQLDFVKKTLLADDHIQQIFGTPNRELSLEEYWALIHPDDKEQKIKFDKERIASKDSSYYSEYRIIRPVDGQIRHIRSQGIFFRNEEGKPMNGVSVVYDQTNEKQNEINLLSSLHEKELLIKEIHHRVKNNLQLISSIIYLKMKTMVDTDTRTFLEETRQKIHSISLIHERLLQTGSINQVNVAEYLGDLIVDLQMTNNDQHFKLHVDCNVEPESISLDTAIYCGLIINELVTNAIKYAFVDRTNGNIKIIFRKFGKGHQLWVSDDGVSLPASVVLGQTNSFGMQMLEIFIKQLKGTVEINREHGTIFNILLE